MGHDHPETISPTAHYTGYVWFAHGHSHEAFATRRGRLMYHALRAPNAAAQLVGMPTLEGMLLARHRLIDLRLSRLIEAGEVEQVIEIAAGLSPRGWRFTRRFPELAYVEADLPDMVAHKRSLLAKVGANHQVVELDALSPTALDDLCASLPARGTAIITEGLINYFDRDTVIGMWGRFARALSRFPRGVYFSDILLREGNRDALVGSFAALLSMFVRSRVHLHFESEAEVEQALTAAGFAPSLLDPRAFASELPGLEKAGAGRVRIIEAVA
jgi:O-methyltransferase involved in polyketide biosynthesis